MIRTCVLNLPKLPGNAIRNAIRNCRRNWGKIKGFSGLAVASYCKPPHKTWILMKEFALFLKTFIAHGLILSKKCVNAGSFANDDQQPDTSND
jgi:hypothetical protein